MTNIEKFKKIMNEEDKVYIGVDLKNVDSLNQKQKEAIINGLDNYNLFKELLDENEKRFISDRDGKLYIAPAIYKDYMKEYELTNAYFSDLLPILFELKIMKENKLGILYFVCEPYNEQHVLINENAENMFKFMNPEDITYLIKKESIDKSRIRK